MGPPSGRPNPRSLLTSFSNMPSCWSVVCLVAPPKWLPPKKPEVSSTTLPCLTQTGEGWCLTPLVFACDASKEDARRQGRTACVGVLGSGGGVKRGRYWQLIGQLLGCVGELRSQTPREPHANWSISAGRLLFSAQKARSKGRRARGWGGR